MTKRHAKDVKYDSQKCTTFETLNKYIRIIINKLDSSHKCNRRIKPQILMPKLINAYSFGVE